MLPEDRRVRFAEFHTIINEELDDGLRQGAISRALWEQGLDAFCGSGGYKTVRAFPVPKDEDIIELLSDIHFRINPARIMEIYHSYLKEARMADTSEQFGNWVSGKEFFKQIVTKKALHRAFGSRQTQHLLQDLANGLPDCPADLIPLFQRLFAH